MPRFSRLSGVAVLATAASAAFSPSADASTIGSCQLNVPSQVRIVSQYQHVRPTVSGTCAGYGQALSASWSGYTSKGMEHFLWFNSTTVTDWDVYEWATPGLTTWRPDSAGESNTYGDFTQNRPTTDVRYGAWAGLRVSHVGSKVVLSANGSRWSAAWDKPIANQTTATIQYKNIGSSTWTNLKTQKVNGSFSYSYTSTAKRDYRVTYNATTYVWAATSPTARG